MSPSLPSLGESDCTCRCYFWSVSTVNRTSTQVTGLSCNGKRRVTVALDCEREELRRCFIEMHNIMNTLLVGGSLINSEYSSRLKYIQFHYCLADEKCKLPTIFEKKFLLPKEAKDCPICVRDKNSCRFARWSEDNFADLPQKNKESLVF